MAMTSTIRRLGRNRLPGWRAQLEARLPRALLGSNGLQGASRTDLSTLYQGTGRGRGRHRNPDPDWCSRSESFLEAGLVSRREASTEHAGIVR